MFRDPLARRDSQHGNSDHLGVSVAIYEGYKTDRFKWFVQKNGSRFRVDASQKIQNHSPDGYSWGYVGSGPSQLSLALLVDAGLDTSRAMALHKLFLWRVVSGWDIDGGWKITTDEICQWVANNENGKRIQ